MTRTLYFLALLLALAACASPPEYPSGSGGLPPCGSLPNCVNSESGTASQAIEPLAATDTQWRALKVWVADQEDWTIVEVAERVSGPIPSKVGYDYIWGDALAALDAAQPSVRIINLETAVTVNDVHWPGKGIHYRMHPANLPVLTAAGVDCCVLANNHLPDWGHDGLEETLAALRRAGTATAGADGDKATAMAPAIVDTGSDRRTLVFSLGHGSSGISRGWAAGDGRAGVWRLEELSSAGVDEGRAAVERFKRSGDIAVASIHWGGNWGYHVAAEMRQFAHDLLDHAGIDLVYGHSSHHPKGIEVYKDRLILYGCGDFINDYEGIGGHEDYRGDLRVMCLPDIDPATGTLTSMTMQVFESLKFRLRKALAEDVAWLAGVLDRESRRLGDTRVEVGQGGLILG